jgi:hypothetical protein
MVGYGDEYLDGYRAGQSGAARCPSAKCRRPWAPRAMGDARARGVPACTNTASRQAVMPGVRHNPRIKLQVGF